MEKNEIVVSTIFNYLKPIKLLCEINDTQVKCTKITIGIPKERKYVEDRSPTIDEIVDEKRRTEKEILNEFYFFRQFTLRFIFDTLSKAIVIKDKVFKNTKRLPRMADFAIWGEAILQSWDTKKESF